MLRDSNSSSSNSIVRRRSGISLVWAMSILIVLCAAASLAVDLGRVHLARTQLRAACDAAALAAGQVVLSDRSAARSAAVEIARANRADGVPVELEKQDIEIGFWDADARTFEPLTGSSQSKANAVRVTAHRTGERENAIDLPFAKIIGKNTCNVSASAIAMATPRKFGVVGLDYIKMSGHSHAGTRANDGRGAMASNGNITLTGSASVDGHAHPGVGRTVIGSSKVSGSVTPLTEPLVYPAADPGNAATINDNARLPKLKNGSLVLGSQQRVTLGSGIYYVKDLTLGAGANIHLTGAATIYVTGNVDLGGHASITSADPDETRIVMIGNSNSMTIMLDGTTAIEGDIYAPGASLRMHGTGDLYGSLVFKSIDITGNSALHYPLGRRGGVVLVK